ncbi:MAG: prolyl-tRNA synthetase associated domain-containing protein [Chloroflexota bacterium]
MDIYQFLDEHDVAYTRYDHPAVYTVEEADALVPDMDGIHTKNLFLRDKKGKRHFLVVAEAHATVNLKELAQKLAVSNVSFASKERLMKYLGIEPGSVSPLALFHDRDVGAVEVAFDRTVWESPRICSHPMANTATLLIELDDLRKFLTATGHGNITLVDF